MYNNLDSLDANFNEEDYGLDIEFPNNEAGFGDAVVWGTDWTLETIDTQVGKGNIDLNPTFQRRDAWNNKKKSDLVESFLLGMPVPPIILAEKRNAKGKYLVIDGKQRLLTICQFRSTNSDFNKLQLNEKMKVLSKLRNKSYADLVDAFSKYKDEFDNQTIRTVVIKNWPNEEFLYEIFLRINSGMVQLSPQELRQALHPGGFVTFLDSATAGSKQFHRLLRNNGADSRMKDIEFALRSFAWRYRFEHYNGKFKIF